MMKKLDGSCGERSGKKKQKNYYHYLRRWERKEEERETKCGRHFSRSLWEEVGCTKHLTGDSSSYIHALFVHISNKNKQQTLTWIKTER